MASFAEQGSVVLPQYQSHVQDYGTLYATIGSQLNQQHLANKQAWLTNIIQPLSQIQVRDEDREEFNKIQERYKSAAEQFEANNDWSKASSFIMDTTADILTNNGLKAMQTAYAQKQEWLKKLDESEWDTRNKLAFRLQMEDRSQAIQYDAENNLVTGGGFVPVTFGEPFDTNKFNKDIIDLIDKIPEEKLSSFGIIADDAELLNSFGIPSVIGANGEKMAQYIIENTTETTRKDPQTIRAAILSYAQSTPEYQNHISTINYNNLYLTMKENGGQLLTTDVLSQLTPIQQQQLVLSGIKNKKGEVLNVNKIGAYDQNGKFIKYKNADKYLADFWGLEERENYAGDDSINYSIDPRTGNTAAGAKANNPLNVRNLTSGEPWRGQTGSITLQNSGSFASFSDPFYGWRAAAKSIEKYPKRYKKNMEMYGNGNLTLASLLHTFAPIYDNNNTEAYIQTVSNQSGIKRDDIIDIKNNKNQFVKLFKAMASVETLADVDEKYLGNVWEALYNGGEIPLMQSYDMTSSNDPNFVDVVDLLQGNTELTPEQIQTYSQNALLGFYNSYNKTNSKESKPTEVYDVTDPNYQTWLQTYTLNIMNDNQIQSFANQMGTTFSYENTSVKPKLHENKVATKYAEKIAEDIKNGAIGGNNSNTPKATTSGISVLDSTNYSDNFTTYNQNEDSKQILQSEIDSTEVPIKLNQTLGYTDDSIVNHLNEIDLKATVKSINDNPNLTDEEKKTYETIVTDLYNKQKSIDSIEQQNSWIKFNTYDMMQKAFDNNMLNDTMQMLFENDIYTWKDYQNKVKVTTFHTADAYETANSVVDTDKGTYGVGWFGGMTDVLGVRTFVSEKDFNDYMQKQLLKINKKLKKKNIEVTPVVPNILFENSELDSYINDNINMYLKGASANLQATYDGEVYKHYDKLSNLFGYDSRDRTVNGKGETTYKLYNEAKDLSAKSEDYGLKGEIDKNYDIGHTELIPEISATSLKEGVLQFKMDIYDTKGQKQNTIYLKDNTLGSLGIISRLAQDYSKLIPLYINENPNKDLIGNSMGVYATAHTNGFMTFDMKGISIPNVIDLQKEVDQAGSEGIKIKLGLTYADNVEHNVRIYKSAGNYYIESLDQVRDATTGLLKTDIYGFIGGARQYPTDPTTGRLQGYSTLQFALNEISKIYLESFIPTSTN